MLQQPQRQSPTSRYHARDDGRPPRSIGIVAINIAVHTPPLHPTGIVIGGVQRRWSTVGRYRVREEQIAACWLLPLDADADADAFDAIWAAP